MTGMRTRESLGTGGFARTWRASDRNHEADRVIKQFHDAIILRTLSASLTQQTVSGTTFVHGSTISIRVTPGI